jgi:16S rRNA (uracil1498-N3)-methyltransferase
MFIGAGSYNGLMNLILLFDDDFTDPSRVRLTGRRLEHVTRVHRAAAGDELTVGMANGGIGRGLITRLDGVALEMEVTFAAAPPPPSNVTLVLALPRPKVLNRVVAAAVSMGIKRLVLINAWRVEKSYWSSPRLHPDNLRAQSILGLEQAKDTMLPLIETRRLFRPFAEEELPPLAATSRALVAHPLAHEACPRALAEPVTLAIGPEGGFIDAELASFQRAGFTPVTLGPRILRVETAIAAIVGRLTP